MNETANALARSGGTEHAHVIADSRSVIQALGAVFAEFRGATGMLVAGSTLANDSGRHRFGQGIYFPLFRPASGSFWPGNVKKLKIVELFDSVLGVDGAKQREIIAQAPLTNPPVPAISPEDGLLLPDALTFWTDPLGADVQAFNIDQHEVPGRDGRSVTRGGAGQRVPGFLVGEVGARNSEPGARQMYTLDPLKPGQLLSLDADPTILAALLPYLDPDNVMLETRGLDTIGWIRGQDSFDSDGDGDRFESRPWLLGAPLHSRPLAVSYGARPGTAYSADNPDIRIFFGSNDGVFHMLANTTEEGEESGRESWAFIPPELLGMQFELAQNHVSALPSHPYGIDGEAVALIRDRDGDGTVESQEGDTVWVFVGQRRGGRSMYAFDMTDPDNPQYMWTISNTTAGFEQLALTFSTPRIARLDLGDGAPTPVLIFRWRLQRRLARCCQSGQGCRRGRRYDRQCHLCR